jgi:hypothetical protein
MLLVSQEEISFEAQKKISVQGNSILLGNTILGNQKTKDFNSQKASNDLIDMKYVDIDEDPKTYSSSAAEILIPETSEEILYAGLYWTGLYPDERSIMKRSSRRITYKNRGDRNPAIDSVYIKAFGQDYTAIKGDVVFNANKKGVFKIDSPYACRADITAYLNSFANPNGMFTVANIKATQGKIEGGSAGGWLLYLICKDSTQSPKYFTTYDGFKQINSKEITIVYTDFQTKTSAL